jgi:methyl-accepting chemotaxis protein
MLSKLKIGHRILLIVAGAIIGIMAVGSYELTEIRTNLFKDREIKTEHVVQTVNTLVSHYYSLEQSGTLTRDEAQKAALAAVEDLRYGNGKEYFWIQSYENVMILHPIKPEMNGKSLNGFKDPEGTPLFEEMVEVVKKDGAGVVHYLWPHPGSDKPVSKISYVEGFAPWGWIIGSGIYVDDVDTIFKDILIVVAAVSLGILALVIVVSFYIGRGITKPLAYISTNMLRLSEGNKDIEVKFTDQPNEIGDLSRTMAVFLEKTIEMERMQKEQEEAERHAEEEKRQLMLKMADDFESSVGGVVNQVSSASTEMQHSSDAMSATAEETNRQSAVVAAASEEASTNVQTVATAAEELSASIGEISRQVSQASGIASNAVRQAQDTNVKVQGLADAANKIGEVVALITDIADQTNLLALNATIEAARAGDAGKGFAVVASEVKNLANQTARATEEIGAQIGGIQSATREAVEAIEAIGKTISQIDDVNAGIASAIEEQGAATQEIARNVEQAAAGTQEVSSNIDCVSQAANETGEAAADIRTAAGELSRQSELLRSEVGKFLASVRAK